MSISKELKEKDQTQDNKDSMRDENKDGEKFHGGFEDTLNQEK